MSSGTKTSVTDKLKNTVYCAVSVLPVYRGPELIISMKNFENQLLLAGWDVTTITSPAADPLSSMSTISSGVFYSDLDFLFSQRLVYKTANNVIAVTSANSGVDTFYTVGAGLASGNIQSKSKLGKPNTD